ncbi:hypothetical protein CISIN_1g0401211mg, partial [Citrus sinensis]
FMETRIDKRRKEI